MYDFRKRNVCNDFESLHRHCMSQLKNSQIQKQRGLFRFHQLYFNIRIHWAVEQQKEKENRENNANIQLARTSFFFQISQR